MYSSVVYHFLTNTLFNLDHGIQDYNRCSNDRRSSSNDSLEPLSFKLCINRNPVVYFNDRASLPIPRSVFLSEIGFNNDANQNVILHQRNAAFPSQGKIREECTIIKKYYWVSIYTKLNENHLSNPLNNRWTPKGAVAVGPP